MFLKGIFTALVMVLSCSPAAKESSVADSAQKLKLISATESVWFGGVRGVRGKDYTIKLRNTSVKKLNFTILNVNGEKIPVNYSLQKDLYTVTARTTENTEFEEQGTAHQTLGTASYSLEYNEAGSKITKKIVIPKFVSVPTVKDGEEPVQ